MCVHGEPRSFSKAAIKRGLIEETQDFIPYALNWEAMAQQYLAESGSNIENFSTSFYRPLPIHPTGLRAWCMHRQTTKVKVDPGDEPMLRPKAVPSSQRPKRPPAAHQKISQPTTAKSRQKTKTLSPDDLRIDPATGIHACAGHEPERHLRGFSAFIAANQHAGRLSPRDPTCPAPHGHGGWLFLPSPPARTHRHTIVSVLNQPDSLSGI